MAEMSILRALSGIVEPRNLNYQIEFQHVHIITDAKVESDFSIGFSLIKTNSCYRFALDFLITNEVYYCLYRDQ